MATHQETARRREALLVELRRSCLDGTLPVGELLPPMRELAGRYEVSQRIVHEVLQRLTDEGLLYSVPRVGTFVGRPPITSPQPFLFLTQYAPFRHPYVAQIQNGFEDRIAQLGGYSDSLTLRETLSHLKHSAPASIGGLVIFDVELPEELKSWQDVPAVHLGTLSSRPKWADEVEFDDQDGAAQATRHLFQLGHRNIAFLGLHGNSGENGDMAWSETRAAGWRQAMKLAGVSPARLEFHPEAVCSREIEDQQLCARTVAKELLKSPGITAVIAVNSQSLVGLCQALRDSEIPADKWPAMVCFDDSESSRALGASYVRLPWEKLGTEAAQMVWDRASGRVEGPVERRTVKMHLIPRLTCRPDWTLTPGLLQRQLLAVPSAKPLVTI